MQKIRFFLIRLLAGKRPVALNLKVDGILTLPAPDGIAANNQCNPQV